MSNLYKQWGVAPKQEGARIINSNAIVAQKIEEMAKKMREQAGTEVDFTDGFSQGLGAENVEAILEEPQADPIEEAKEEAEREAADAAANAARKKADRKSSSSKSSGSSKSDAQTQKAELLEQAKEEGRTRGYDEGKAKADAEEQEMQRHLQQLEESLNTDYRNKLQHMEQQVVEVVVHVFEKVFHIQFDDKTEILLSLVSDAIMGIEGSKDFRIRVAEVNFEFMENHRHELEERVGEDISLEMIADPMLEENQCMIETDSGIFNCSLGVQLENLIKDLKSLSIN